MKIVLFTPGLTTSAIGRMAALVVMQLSERGHSLVVVRTEAPRLLSRPAHHFGVPLSHWTDDAHISDAIKAADLIVHQIGNNYDFHMGSLEWLPRAPAVVCLHDFYLAHLFHGWASTHMGQAKRLLARWNGVDSAEAFFLYANSARFIELTRDTMPMTEWVADMAAGVITHSSWGIARVANACAGPVWTIPLAYDIPACSEKVGTLALDPAPAHTIKLLTVGHINPNKRIESVIEAIAGSPFLREKVCYRLVGSIEPLTIEHLESMASSLGVRLLISGEVDEFHLAEAFGEADIVSCLRWPSLESASASAIEALLHGKPMLVTATGFYNEIPDTCAIKIDQADEIEAVRRALELFCMDMDAARSMGAAAQAWAANIFTPLAYACKLEEIAMILPRASVTNAIGRYFGNMLGAWGGASLAGEVDMGALAILDSR
jgi:glycosyltransferase involved in cell wall biosynthesis